MSLVEKLSETGVLWISFVATVAITFVFQLVAGSVGGTLLDSIADPDQTRDVLVGMSEAQRAMHAWLTGTLDVAYPAAYGALFIGSAIKFYPSFGRYLAWTVFILVPVDLIEGIVQILALTDLADLLSTKAVLTSLKQILFIFALLFTVVGWVKWLISRVVGTKKKIG
ncbi:MAG: hypothetical protein GKR90_09400 [Pseudomonadales bacterium]|nr:hypothetical protein [Pseudomonadales bacterium]